MLRTPPPAVNLTIVKFSPNRPDITDIIIPFFGGAKNPLVGVKLYDYLD